MNRDDWDDSMMPSDGELARRYEEACEEDRLAMDRLDAEGEFEREELEELLSDITARVEPFRQWAHTGHTPKTFEFGTACEESISDVQAKVVREPSGEWRWFAYYPVYQTGLEPSRVTAQSAAERALLLKERI